MGEVGAEVPVQIENNPSLGHDTVNVGKDRVERSWAKFIPEGGESTDSNKAVFFLQGWPWKSESTTIWDQPRMLSQEFGVPTYAMDTKVDRIAPDALFIEAEAIRQFIEQQKLKEVTIFGHSEGAIRAANLAVLLEQKNPDIKINGVVSANPMGLYPQSFFKELAPNFISEVIKVEPKEQNPKMPHTFQIWLRSMVEFAKSAPKNPKRFAQEMIEMMKVNERLKQIKAPVVVITTEKDFVSDYRKYMPEAEIQKRMAEPQSMDDLRRYAEGRFDSLPDQVKSRYENKEAYVNTYMKKFESAEYMKKFRTREEIARRGRTRKEYLGIDVIVATKYGSHIGLPVERPNQTAHVVSRIFERLSRVA